MCVGVHCKIIVGLHIYPHKTKQNKKSRISPDDKLWLIWEISCLIFSLICDKQARRFSVVFSRLQYCDRIVYNMAAWQRVNTDVSIE